MIALVVFAVVALLILALSAWRLSVLHMHLAEAYQLISDMIKATDLTDAEALAARHMVRMKARRWWQ